MSINLLLPSTKENLKLDQISRSGMFVCELALTVLVLFALTLLGETLYASSKLATLNSRVHTLSTRTEAQELTQFQQQLRLLKDDVERLGRIQRQHPNHLQVLSRLFALLSSNTRLTALAIDFTGKNIVFSGIAQTRADLIMLRDRLGQDPSYTGLNFPLADLLKETNIMFTISATLVSPAT